MNDQNIIKENKELMLKIEELDEILISKDAELLELSSILNTFLKRYTKIDDFRARATYYLCENKE